MSTLPYIKFCKIVSIVHTLQCNISCRFIGFKKYWTLMVMIAIRIAFVIFFSSQYLHKSWNSCSSLLHSNKYCIQDDHNLCICVSCDMCKRRFHGFCTILIYARLIFCAYWQTWREEDANFPRGQERKTLQIGKQYSFNFIIYFAHNANFCCYFFKCIYCIVHIT